MATTRLAHSRHDVRSLPVRFVDKYFYFSMSLLVAAVVVYGFSHTIGDNLIHPAIPRPLLLYFHGACHGSGFHARSLADRRLTGG